MLKNLQQLLGFVSKCTKVEAGETDRWPVWRVEKGWKRGPWLKPTGEGSCVLCSSPPLRSQAGPGNGWDPRLHQHPRLWPDIRTHPPWAGPDILRMGFCVCGHCGRSWCHQECSHSWGIPGPHIWVLAVCQLLCALCVCDALKRLKPRGAAYLVQGHTTWLTWTCLSSFVSTRG